MYCIIDKETSIYESFGRRANPFDPRNYVVANGLKYQDGRKFILHKLVDKTLYPDGWLNGVTCLVGHNIKFDLLYIWGRKDVQQWLKDGGRIYDTQYAEYLITGQHNRFENGAGDGLNLDALSAIYGGTVKPDKIKEYWEAGIQTIDIPVDELCEYLDGDICNTEKIFLGQIKKYVPMGMTNTVKAHMEGLLGTIEMEYNGLKVDESVGEVHKRELEKEIADVTSELNSYIPKNLPDTLEWNWGSSQHVSALFFGGSLKYKVRVQKTDDEGSLLFTKATETVYIHKDGRFISSEQFAELADKSCLEVHTKGKKVGEYATKKLEVQGNPKMHTIEQYFTITGITEAKEHWKTKTEGFYQTGDKIITALAAEGVTVAKTIHKLKKLTKLLAFYRYTNKDGEEKGLLTMIQSDGMIHHKLNTVTTVTGRLSSSDPNMQQCFDGETEILTPQGFVKFSEFSRGEDGAYPYVAEYNLATGRISWTRIKKFIKYDYTGTMVRYVCDHIDFYGTEDHRFVVDSSSGKRFLKAKFLDCEAGRFYRNVVILNGRSVVANRVNEFDVMDRIAVEGFTVYCVRVPRKAIVVRRNGKTYISGNCPRSDTGKVREMFTSRWGEDGLLGEVDFSQLEVHGQAELSGDRQMIKDVTNKLDFHCVRAAAKLGEPYEEVKLKAKDENHPEHKKYKTIRTGAKMFSFQRAYGASVATIAADTGMALEDVQALADSEEKLYPSVVEFNNSNIEAVTRSAYESGVTVLQFNPAIGKQQHFGVGFLVSPTGKRYSFVEQTAPEWMIQRAEKDNDNRERRGLPRLPVKVKGIAPQQVKNYPVQGFCGEVVLNVIGVLFREFLKRNRWDNKALLINTVHDCIWVDCHKSVAKEVILFVKQVMENAAQIMRDRYKIDISVPFYADAEIGKNFYDMTHCGEDYAN